MKYTKYLIDGEFIDPNVILSNNFYLKLPTRVLAVVVSIVGITAISGIMPMAIMIDSYRNTKSRMIHYKRAADFKRNLRNL